MGYFKIVQYANVTETYDYQKRYNKPRQRKKKRRKYKDKPKRIILQRNIKRARTNFFRLVAHNNHLASSITFLTVTYHRDYSYGVARQHFSNFFTRLRKYVKTKDSTATISYIGVPERTKKGRIHLHVLVYNLPPEIVQRERFTRNLQVLYRRGYIDVRLAYDKSQKIASYMAKYLSKAMSDPDHEAIRFYNCSRNINKVTSWGFNEEFVNYDLVMDNIPTGSTKKIEYPTIYLGKCTKTTITT